MEKTITIIFGIFLISNVYAISLNAGDSYSFELGKPFAYYIISGNQTIIDLNISQNNSLVTIQINKYLKDCNFTITFYGEKGEEVIPRRSSGSSRSHQIIPYLDNYSDLESYLRDYNTTNITNNEETEIIEFGQDKINLSEVFLVVGIILVMLIALYFIIKKE